MNDEASHCISDGALAGVGCARHMSDHCIGKRWLERSLLDIARAQREAYAKKEWSFCLFDIGFPLHLFGCGGSLIPLDLFSFRTTLCVAGLQVFAGTLSTRAVYSDCPSCYI